MMEVGVSSGTWEIVDNKLIVKEDGFGKEEITFFKIIGTTLKVGQYNNEFESKIDKMSSHFYK